MNKALVVYATRMNQTRRIGELIAEGARMGGAEVTLLSVAEYEKEKPDLQDYDAVVLGSATYHGEMMQPMKTLLFALEKGGLEGKAGASFGAFGWSGEAAGRIYDTMKNVFGMQMVGGPLMLKSAALGGALQMAHEYGREIAGKISSKQDSGA